MIENLAGKRVLITGASSGIGAELAVGFAAQGAVVGLCARREDRLNEVLARVRDDSPDSQSWAVDLGDIGAIDDFAATVVGELGGLDVLVNNAGIPKRRWAWAHRPDEVSDVLRVNVESPIRLTLALLDALGEGEGGSVVFVGSVAARLAPPAEAVYSASKAAVTAFAEGLSVDLQVAARPISVHVLQPGVIATELFELPDNDRSIADVEALPVSAVVDPVIDMVTAGSPFELFLPGWFADIPPIKASDLGGFLQGSVEYTRQRLDTLGWELPS